MLHRFSLALGQEINLEKSTLVFSRIAGTESVEEVKSILLGQVVEKHDKYLRLPNEMGRSKKGIFGWLCERVWKKVDNFGNKSLSKVGNEVLSQSFRL